MLKDSTHLYFEHKTIPEDDATSYDNEEKDNKRYFITDFNKS